MQLSLPMIVVFLLAILLCDTVNAGKRKKQRWNHKKRGGHRRHGHKKGHGHKKDLPSRESTPPSLEAKVDQAKLENILTQQVNAETLVEMKSNARTIRKKIAEKLGVRIP